MLKRNLPPIEVGQTIYVKSGNWSRCYVPRIVIGETSRSWIVAKPGDEHFFKSEWYVKQARKLPKNGKDWDRGDEQDHKLGEWASSHARALADWVGVEKDLNKIVAIARILEYPHLPEEGKC